MVRSLLKVLKQMRIDSKLSLRLMLTGNLKSREVKEIKSLRESLREKENIENQTVD